MLWSMDNMINIYEGIMFNVEGVFYVDVEVGISVCVSCGDYVRDRWFMIECVIVIGLIVRVLMRIYFWIFINSSTTPDTAQSLLSTFPPHFPYFSSFFF